MKKSIRSILALLLAFNLTAVPAAADFNYSAIPVFAEGEEIAEESVKEFSSGSFVFRVNDDGETCSLISFEHEDSYEAEDAASVTIPESVSYDGKDYQVTAIENRAFSQKNIVSASIPSTVSFIGFEAFADNQYLEEIDIPDSVTEIGLGAFAGTGLKSVTIPGSIKDLGCCFNHCYDLENVVIEDGVETIALGCFFGDDRLKSFEYTDSLVFADPFNMQNHRIKGTERLQKISEPFVYDETTFTIYRKYEDHAEVVTTVDFAKVKSDIDGLPVTALAANGMFESMYEFEIPSFIKKIGKYSCAFSSGKGDILYIPSTVEEIERDAFVKSFFTAVSLPKNITDPEKIFTFCDDLNPANIVYDSSEIVIEKGFEKLSAKSDRRIDFEDGYNGNLWLVECDGTLEYFGDGKFESVWDTDVEYFGYCGKDFRTVPDVIQMDYEIEADENDEGTTCSGILCHGNDYDEYFLVDYYTPKAYEYITSGAYCGDMTVNGEEYGVYYFEFVPEVKFYYCIRKAGSVNKNSVDAVSFIKALGRIDADAGNIYDANVFVQNNSGKGRLNLIKNDIQEVYSEKVADTTQPIETEQPEETTAVETEEGTPKETLPTRPVETEAPVTEKKADTSKNEDSADKDKYDINSAPDTANYPTGNSSSWRSGEQSVHVILGAPVSEDKEIIYGDINGDGVADLTDLTYLSLYLMNSAKFNDDQMKAADVDGNGEVDIADLPYFKQYVSKDVKVQKLGPKDR